MSVGLFGNWNGRIEVRMARNLADMATAAMLMQPVEAVVEADTLDATREIVNMIAEMCIRDRARTESRIEAADTSSARSAHRMRSCPRSWKL